MGRTDRCGASLETTIVGDPDESGRESEEWGGRIRFCDSAGFPYHAVARYRVYPN